MPCHRTSLASGPGGQAVCEDSNLSARKICAMWLKMKKNRGGQPQVLAFGSICLPWYFWFDQTCAMFGILKAQQDCSRALAHPPETNERCTRRHAHILLLSAAKESERQQHVCTSRASSTRLQAMPLPLQKQLTPHFKSRLDCATGLPLSLGTTLRC